MKRFSAEEKERILKVYEAQGIQVEFKLDEVVLKDKASSKETSYTYAELRDRSNFLTPISKESPSGEQQP